MTKGMISNLDLSISLRSVSYECERIQEENNVSRHTWMDFKIA